METHDERPEAVAPSEQRGGTRPGEEEARKKGPWAATAEEGVVSPELGGSDAPSELVSSEQHSEMGDSVLGATTGSGEPATESGVDPSAGERADATSDSPPQPAEDVEPDLKDAARGPRQVDTEST